MRLRLRQHRAYSARQAWVTVVALLDLNSARRQNPSTSLGSSFPPHALSCTLANLSCHHNLVRNLSTSLVSHLGPIVLRDPSRRSIRPSRTSNTLPTLLLQRPRSGCWAPTLGLPICLATTLDHALSHFYQTMP